MDNGFRSIFQRFEDVGHVIDGPTESDPTGLDVKRYAKTFLYLCAPFGGNSNLMNED